MIDPNQQFQERNFANIDLGRQVSLSYADYYNSQRPNKDKDADLIAQHSQNYNEPSFAQFQASSTPGSPPYPMKKILHNQNTDSKCSHIEKAVKIEQIPCQKKFRRRREADLPRSYCFVTIFGSFMIIILFYFIGTFY